MSGLFFSLRNAVTDNPVLGIWSLRLQPALYLNYFVAILLALCFSTQTLASKPQETPATLTDVSVQLNWHHQFQFAGFYAAIQQGYYHQAGLNVTLKPWHKGINPLQEVTNDTADFGVGISSVITDFSKGADIRLVMSAFQYSPLVLLSHYPVKDLQQLAGKRIMYNGGIQITMLLAKNDFKPEQKPQILNSSGDLNDFISGKVDLYGAYMSNEPYQLEKQGIEYHILDPKNYGMQSYSGLVFTAEKTAMTNPKLVEAFRDATIRGWEFALQNPQEVINFLTQNYPVNKTPESLLHEASTLKKYIQLGNTKIGDIDHSKIIAFLSEAARLDIISQKDFQSAQQREILFNGKAPLFSQQEISFIQQHQQIIVDDLVNYPPFQFTQNQISQGLIQDYLDEISNTTGISFINQSQLDPSQRKKLNSNTPILYPAVTPSHIGNNQLLLTDKYLSFPLVLMGLNSGGGFIQDLSLLNGHTIAVRKDSFPHHFLRLNYPNIQLLPVDSVNEGLVEVQLKRALAIADNLPALNYVVNDFGYSNMQVIGQIKSEFGFSMATERSQPVLFSIIKKALAKIDQTQRLNIYRKWLNPKSEIKFNYQQFWKLLAPLLLLILFMGMLLAFNYRKQRYLNQIYELSYANVIDATSMKIVWTSQSFSKLSGYSAKELVGLPYLKLAGPSVGEEAIRQIYQQVILEGKTWSGELAAVRKDGEEYWVELTLTPSKNLFGKVTNVLATRVDISDRKKVEAISITDELTGLYNRRYFDQRLPNEIKRALREKQGLAFLMLDLDFFKKINDDYGHQIGDEVLVEVATSINTYFNRANDFVFRIGGEEFFVITHFDKLRAFAVHLNNLQESIRHQKIENKNSPLGYLTLSLGGLFCSHECMPKENQILRYTDQLLYQSKENGRNRMTIKTIEISEPNHNQEANESCCQQRDFENFEALMEDEYT